MHTKSTNCSCLLSKNLANPNFQALFVHRFFVVPATPAARLQPFSRRSFLLGMAGQFEKKLHQPRWVKFHLFWLSRKMRQNWRLQNHLCWPVWNCQVFNNLHGIVFKNSRKWSTPSSGMPFFICQIAMIWLRVASECQVKTDEMSDSRYYLHRPWNLISKKNTMKHVEQVFREDSFWKTIICDCGFVRFRGEFKSSTKRNFIMPEACQTRNLKNHPIK